MDRNRKGTFAFIEDVYFFIYFFSNFSGGYKVSNSINGITLSARYRKASKYSASRSADLAH
jgi:hypothetical protein